MGPKRLSPRSFAPHVVGAEQAGWALRSSPGPRRLTLALVIGWFAVIAVGGWALVSSLSDSRHTMAARVESRTQYSAMFISSYAKDLLARDRAAAESWLGAPRISRAALGKASAALGLQAAAVSDAQAGAPNTSMSLIKVAGAPAIAFAVRYGTPSGERVFSAAYAISDTVLPVVLDHMFAMPGWRAELIDPNGTRITAGPGSHQGQLLYFRAEVAGTGWRIVVSDPPNELYGFLEGAGEWIAWLALAGLTLAGLAVIFQFVRLQGRRAQLTTLNLALAQLAAVDPLTGLRNRRVIEQYLSDSLSAARRHDLPLSLLVIDVDHFKTFNDKLGHQRGDAVLAHAARVLDGALRAEDAIGRWGGEEFLVVLPGTDEEGALSVTDRLRTALIAEQPEEARAHELRVTITIGLAEWRHESIGELISRADDALYLGKAAGRDTVWVARDDSPQPEAAKSA